MSLKLLKAEKHMDLSSMTELPDLYAWSSVDADSYAWASSHDRCLLSYSSEPVPVINLQDPNVINHVGHACKTWGVFHVTNHGIPMAVLDDMRLREVVEEYNKELKTLANRLIVLILGSLDIRKGDVKWAEPTGDLTEACPALQLNSYPACPDPDRAMGLAAHTDSTLLTILQQNNTSGFQVQREGTGWVTVQPIPEALVVHVGDLLHILSNGLYSSVLHRAMVNRTQHRLSIAYLYGPPSNARISPLSKLTSITHPPLYQPVTWSEYLAIKAKYFNKTLSVVRLSTPMNEFVDLKDHKSVIVG